MIIGTAEIILYLPDNHSLKEKRSTLKSLLTRLSNKFNAAVAEVADQDKWQKATIGVAVIGGSTAHAHSQLQSIIQLVEGEHKVMVGEIITEVF